MAVLYQVEEQGRQTAFVGEKEGGFTVIPLKISANWHK